MPRSVSHSEARSAALNQRRAGVVAWHALVAGSFIAFTLTGCSVLGLGHAEDEPVVRMGTVQNVRTVYVNPADERAGVTASGAEIPPAALQAETRYGTGPEPSSPQVPDQTGVAGEDSARRLEITVKLDDGEVRAVVQAAAQFNKGEKVKLVADKGRVEVIH